MKRGEFATIWRHGRVYSVANVLNRVAGLVLLPVYLHVLAPAEYGLLALVTLTADILGVVLGLGLGRALLRLYVGAADEPARDRLVVSALLLLLALGAVFAALAAPLAELASRVMFGHDAHATVFFYANLGIVFTVLFNFELSCLVARKASAVYLWASLAKTLLMLTLNIVLVVHLEAGVLGVVLGTLISSVVVAGALLLELLRGRALRGSAAAMRELVAFAAPLVPSVLIDTVVVALDKVVLNRLSTAAAVGGYATGQRLSSLLQLFVVQPFMQIWAVRQLEVLDHPDSGGQASLTRIFELFLVLLSSGALAAALFAPELLALIAAPGYAHAAQVVPLLALAEIVLLFRSYFEIGVFHARATRLLPWVSLASLLFAVPLYVAMIHWLGMLGAAFAFLLTACARVAMVAVVARRVSPFGSDLAWRRILLTVAAAIVVYAVARALGDGDGTLGAAALKLGALG
ncbi:MAG: oligosaccharide flippase family protein, partial [Gammaproteobacteria bacterium]